MDSIKDLAESFRAVQHMSHTCMDREMTARGLKKASNPKILFVLRDHMDVREVPQKQLADWIGVAPPTIAVSVKRMERAGLVRKVVNPSDLRENYIQLTEEGVRLADESRDCVRGVYLRMFQGFSQEEVDAFQGYIGRLIGNLEDMGATRPFSAGPTATKEGGMST